MHWLTVTLKGFDSLPLRVQCCLLGYNSCLSIGKLRASLLYEIVTQSLVQGGRNAEWHLSQVLKRRNQIMGSLI